MHVVALYILNCSPLPRKISVFLCVFQYIVKSHFQSIYMNNVDKKFLVEFESKFKREIPEICLNSMRFLFKSELNDKNIFCKQVLI